jgi:hypothetical protein
MVIQLNHNQKTELDIGFIYTARRYGASLQQIGELIGRTKEGVRQILLRNYGSSKHEFLSTFKLCSLSGLSRDRVLELHHHGIITPVKEWDTDIGHYYLWAPDTWRRIAPYNRMNGVCRMCHSPNPKGRRHYCSRECYMEGQKYKNKTDQGKKRHLDSIRKYRSRLMPKNQATSNRPLIYTGKVT